MEGLIFVIIAGLLSLVFKSAEKSSEGGERTKKPDPRALKKAAEQTQEKVQEREAPAPRPEREAQASRQETAPRRKVQPEKKPAAAIDSWTEDDVVRGIVFSEILAPPKSKRKK